MTTPRRILLATTGLYPQIVTETLYALAVQPGEGQTPFIPTEVHLISTSEGARLARNALLHPDGGQFHALLAEYPQLGKPCFDESHIHVICNSDGTALPDIRSPQENAVAADAITALVARLTSDSEASLHVSIAGGRKTMGFYLGYAFSLYARPQDALSHVLVSAPFESHPDFFFPPATPRRLATRSGQHLDTADARVTLARIPIVHLRHGLPAGLRNGTASFNESVAAIERSLAPPHLNIDLHNRQVHCGDTPVQLPPAQLAWLAWWAMQASQQRPPINWRQADANEYLQLYRRVVGVDAQAYENAQQRLAQGMEKEFFEQSNAKLKRYLTDQLGPAASAYLPTASGKRPHTRHQLPLSPDAITLIV